MPRHDPFAHFNFLVDFGGEPQAGFSEVSGLASEVEQLGWDTSILAEVEKAATEALAPRADDLERAKQGMDWMYKWKAVHPQFNTVEDGGY